MAIPTHYECKDCGARGVKLWREYQITQPTLLCRKCSEIEQKDNGSPFHIKELFFELKNPNDARIVWLHMTIGHQ